MAFEYTPYRSPFVGAIADLIGQRGDIAAQQALNEAKVRSQAVSSVAQSLGNLAQYQADAPKRRLEQAMLAEKQQQLADAQAARAGKQSLATLLSPDYAEGFQPQGPTPVDASGEAGILPKSPSLVKNIGGVKQFDVDAIQAAMGQLGHGAWFLENRNAIDSLNKSMLDRHVLGKQLGREAADLYLKAARKSDSIAQATEKDTMGASFKVQAAHTLVDALDDLIPSEQREAIQKALVVGDTRMADELAQKYATPDKIEMVKTGPGDVVTPVNQFAEQVGPAIKGAPVQPPQPPFQMVQAIALGTPPEQRTPEQVMLAAAWQKEHPGTKLTPEQLYFDAVARQFGKANASELTADELGQAQRQYRDNTTRAPREPQPPSDVSTYNQISSRIEAIAKPIEERRANLQKIVDTLNTKNAVADSLVAPELLTAMAGGAGSGIRINEAEIKRVLGARSTLDDVRAMLMKVQSGETVTENVRNQINQLVGLVKGKIDRKVEVINKYRQALAKSDSIESHRQLFADMNEQLGGIDTEGTFVPEQLPSLGLTLGQSAAPRQVPSNPVRGGR